MGYVEQRVAPGVEVWRSTGTPGPQRILPDGCLDLLYDGERLLVAGPDRTARVHQRTGVAPMSGVRLHAGRAPLLLGLPADELSDRTVPLADLWGDRRARELTARVADDPWPAMTTWATRAEPGPFGPLVLRLLDRGASVAAVADALGYSTRQLQRRTHATFGYGPQHLARVLRLGRAVARADTGLAWAEVAQAAGYVDQAHLTRDVRALAGVTPTRLRAERVRSVQDAA